MNRIVTVILCLMIVVCSSYSDHKTLISAGTLSCISVKTDTTKKVLTTKTSDFNVKKFIESADSLLTTMLGKRVHFSFTNRKHTSDKTDEGTWAALNPTSKILIKQYSFYPVKENRLYSLYFIEASYPDTSDASTAFEALRVLSEHGSDNIHDHCPGLTKGNDYVIRTDKKIYWLNWMCMYKSTDHQKLSGLIRQSLQFESIIDSIHCHCGQVKCKL